MFDTKILDFLGRLGYYVEIVDNNGVFLYATDSCEDIKDISKDIIGKNVVDIYNMTDGNESLLLKTITMRKSFKNIFWSYKATSGKDYFYIMDTSPLIIDGKQVGVLAISKPYQDIKNTVDRVNNLRRVDYTIVQNKSRQNTAQFSFDDIIYQNSAMALTVDNAKKIAVNPSSVLVFGETGTGKELFAHSIHQHSRQSKGPFVTVNCGAIPDTLMESTLFGTSKGSFTGAIEKKGLFEEAENGTIFLDEINSMGIDMQAKLLRALETRKIRRVGSNNEININTRIISAVNIDPIECVESGKIRTDLFYRLAVASVKIPSLRERSDDIPLLVDFFISRNNIAYNKNIQRLSNDVLDMFKQYQWPGNVRELQHVIEHAMNIANDDETILQKHHMPFFFVQQFENRFVPVINQYAIEDYKVARAKVLAECEATFVKNFISGALKSCDGNISQTARQLNITRQHLHKLINEYCIQVP